MDFRVSHVMNWGFGWFGTVLLRFLPNCINMMGILCGVCCYCANLGWWVSIASNLCCSVGVMLSN